MGVVSRCVIIGIVALAAWPRHAAARDYPTHSVTILVPFAPGGGTDLIARAVGQKLEQRLGESFVIENRPGAGMSSRRITTSSRTISLRIVSAQCLLDAGARRGLKAPGVAYCLCDAAGALGGWLARSTL
jgi:tripartite-type tricarboxylate transporter receptor subunit TctC